MVINCGCCLCIYRPVGWFIGHKHGAGSGQIWLDNIRCNGTETDIADCQHKSWGRCVCDHSKDISVKCLTVTGTVTHSLQLQTPSVISELSFRSSATSVHHHHIIISSFIRLDALALAKALSVIATATWLGGWVAGWLGGCHTPVLYQNG